MGRRRPDWWSEQQQQQQQQHQHQQQQQRQQHQQEQQKREQDSGPVQDDGCPRNAANARERARMRVLSKAFGRLKTTLPWVPADTKLSKLDTLRLATTYIAHLSSLLAGTERSDAAAITATTATPAAAVVTSSNQPDYATTWPYNVHSSVDECSSPEDDYHRYDCYNAALMEPKSSYSTYETYYASSINS